MSPRPYQLGQRQAAVDATRQKVLDAARALLADPDGSAAFSLDAVARRADVARATVYYRFESRSGLLEALFDTLAANGRMADLAGAFTHPDPAGALSRFVACFGRFWASDRLVLRRIRAIAVLDPEVGAVIAARDERRRTGLRVLAGRFGAVGEDRVDVLHALTSFETFDTLAGPGREPDEVIPLVTELVLRVMTGG
ncbi:MAG TPA: helix-turn-helix domain-containing protein [Actinocrinis sp.]|nr:helix-turn-helix domain-containing protein [Actinocrinis sp.]